MKVGVVGGKVGAGVPASGRDSGRRSCCGLLRGRPACLCSRWYRCSGVEGGRCSCGGVGGVGSAGLGVEVVAAAVVAVGLDARRDEWPEVLLWGRRVGFPLPGRRWMTLVSAAAAAGIGWRRRAKGVARVSVVGVAYWDCLPALRQSPLDPANAMDWVSVRYYRLRLPPAEL